MLMLIVFMMTAQEGSPIKLAEVDASKEKILSKREGVRLIIFHCLKFLEYDLTSNVGPQLPIAQVVQRGTTSGHLQTR